MMSRPFTDQAKDLIRAAGARVTRARVEVLATLLAAERALTQREVEKHVGRARGINRVTVYRVLDWLTANRLAHKIAGDDRVWRYNRAPVRHEPEHAHFQCNHCGSVICLDDAGTMPRIRLPRGYRRQHADLTVRGLCAGCAPGAGRLRAGRP